MNCHLPALGLILSLLMIAGAKPRKDAVWKEFTSKDGGFVVTMPGTPKEDKKNRRTASGPVELVLYIVERKQEETVFVAGYCELPEAVVKGATADKRMEYARRRVLADIKGKLLKEKKITLGTHPGRELHIGIEGGGVVRQRLFAVKDKLYQLLVVGPKAKALSKDSDRFMDSFKLK
jgi:hypothetical protein